MDKRQMHNKTSSGIKKTGSVHTIRLPSLSQLAQSPVPVATFYTAFWTLIPIRSGSQRGSWAETNHVLLEQRMQRSRPWLLTREEEPDIKGLSFSVDVLGFMRRVASGST
ncbi:hypothetical protein CLAIMM_12047 [Cladophialophora immunda]|nr:hypothetical protein CLAIMM_12047 [Cladophialophora immunda]